MELSYHCVGTGAGRARQGLLCGHRGIGQTFPRLSAECGIFGPLSNTRAAASSCYCDVQPSRNRGAGRSGAICLPAPETQYMKHFIRLTGRGMYVSQLHVVSQSTILAGKIQR